MTQEALKLALEALESAVRYHGIMLMSDPPQDAWKYHRVENKVDKAITAIKEALAQEQDGTYVYASSLATAIWQKHYIKDSPKWKPLDTTDGVLTQIDNMTCGLVREKTAQPEQEPVAWISPKGHIHFDPYLDSVPLYTTPPQRTWVGLTDEEIELYWDWEDFQCGCGPSTLFAMVRDIESRLKDRNT